MLPPGAIFQLKIHQNAFAAGALSRTPLEELAALLQTPSWFSGAASLQGEERGEEGREGGKPGKRKAREGRGAFPHFFFII